MDKDVGAPGWLRGLGFPLLVSAQVMISWLRRWSSQSGSALTEWDSVLPSSSSPARALVLKINKLILKTKTKTKKATKRTRLWLAKVYRNKIKHHRICILELPVRGEGAEGGKPSRDIVMLGNEGQWWKATKDLERQRMRKMDCKESKMFLYILACLGLYH